MNIEKRDLFRKLNEKPIVFNPMYAKITGSINAGLLLSQIIYLWVGIGDKFWRTNDKLCVETGMTISELKSAKNLVKKFVKVTVEGLPARSFYEPDLDSIIQAIQLVGITPTSREESCQHSNIIIQDNVKEIDFSKEKSSLKSKKPETEEETTIEMIDEDGNPLVNRFGKKKDAPKTAGKNKIALRLIHEFGELCQKNCDTKPISGMKEYKMVLYALNTGGLCHSQLTDLFDWWFSLGRPDEEAIQITRALSANNINIYKVQNNVK